MVASVWFLWVNHRHILHLILKDELFGLIVVIRFTGGRARNEVRNGVWVCVFQMVPKIWHLIWPLGTMGRIIVQIMVKLVNICFTHTYTWACTVSVIDVSVCIIVHTNTRTLIQRTLICALCQFNFCMLCLFTFIWTLMSSKTPIYGILFATITDCSYSAFQWDYITSASSSIIIAV